MESELVDARARPRGSLMDPRELFLFENWVELGTIAFRALVVYLAAMLFLRVAGKRALMRTSPFDFVLHVALGSTLAITILTGVLPLLGGLVALAVLVLVHEVVARTARRSDRVRKLLEGEPSLLLYRGEVIEAALSEHNVRREEILAALRDQGLAELEQAEAVVLEPNGKLNVVRRWPKPGEAPSLGDVRPPGSP